MIDPNSIEIIKSHPEGLSEESLLANKIALQIGLKRICYNESLIEHLLKFSEEIGSVYKNIDFPSARLSLDSIVDIIKRTPQEIDGFNVGLDYNHVTLVNFSAYIDRLVLATSKPIRIPYDISKYSDVDFFKDFLTSTEKLSGIILFDSLNMSDITDCLLFYELGVRHSKNTEFSIFSKMYLEEVEKCTLPDNLIISTNLSNVINYFGEEA